MRGAGTGTPLCQHAILNVYRFAPKVLAVVQFCGILPVTGIRRSRSTPQATAFKWLSVRVIYSLCFMVSLSVIIYLYLNRLKQAGFTAKRIAGCIVLVVSLLSCVLFLRLARRWRVLIEHWNRTDAVFLRLPYSVHRYRLSTKIRVVAGVWLLLALGTVAPQVQGQFITMFSFVGEHMVYLLQKVIVQQDQIQRCRWQVDDRVRHFLLAEHNHIFERIPYSLPLGILISVSVNYVFVSCV